MVDRGEMVGAGGAVVNRLHPDFMARPGRPAIRALRVAPAPVAWRADCHRPRGAAPRRIGLAPEGAAITMPAVRPADERNDALRQRQPHLRTPPLSPPLREQRRRLVSRSPHGRRPALETTFPIATAPVRLPARAPGPLCLSAGAARPGPSDRERSPEIPRPEVTMGQRRRGKGRRKVGRKKRRMRAKIRHRK